MSVEARSELPDATTTLSFKMAQRPGAVYLRCCASHLITFGVLEFLLFATVVWLASNNLAASPQTWFDEGVLLLASKAFVQTGAYGLLVDGTLRPFDPLLTSGPTVILLPSLFMQVFGIGLAQARISSVVYMLAAAVGLYVVSRMLSGRLAGGIALLVFASATEMGAFVNGRAVLGELPALAFCFWGIALWIQGERRQSPTVRVLAGGVFGLAILSKGMFVLLLLALALVQLTYGDRSRRRALGRVGTVFLGIAVPLLCWELVKIFTLGRDGYASYLSEVGAVAASHPGLRASNWVRSAHALLLVMTSWQAVASWVGVLYVALLARSHPPQRRAELLFIPVLVSVWFCWFVGLSVGWSRYVTPAVLLGSVLCGHMARDLVEMALRSWQTSASGGTRPVEGSILSAIVLGLGTLIFAGILQNAVAILRVRDDTPQAFARIVEREVPVGVTVELADASIAFLADRPYRLLTQQEVDAGTRFVFLRSQESAPARVVPASVLFVVDGPYSKLTGLYRQALADSHFRNIASAGEFDLYRREP